MNKRVRNVGSRNKKWLYFFLESRCRLEFKIFNHKIKTVITFDELFAKRKFRKTSILFERTSVVC